MIRSHLRPSASGLRHKLVIPGPNHHCGIAAWRSQTFNTGRASHRLAAFGDWRAWFRRQNDCCSYADWHPDPQVELARVPMPFADDLAAHRIVTRLDPFQVADRLRPDDELIKTDRVRRRVDAGQRPVEPFAHGAEHWMVVGEGVVTEFPMLPERGRAV